MQQSSENTHQIKSSKKIVRSHLQYPILKTRPPLSKKIEEECPEQNYYLNSNKKDQKLTSPNKNAEAANSNSTSSSNLHEKNSSQFLYIKVQSKQQQRKQDNLDFLRQSKNTSTKSKQSGICKIQNIHFNPSEGL